MKSLRCLLLLPLLLMQVWPVGWGQAADDHQVACEMDCCAWLVEAGLSESCACVEESGAPTRPSPALPSSEVGVGKVAQVAWATDNKRIQRRGNDTEKASVCMETAGVVGRPHVRLTVLFGAFLI